MNQPIYEEIVRLQRAGAPFALATVIDHSGSSPRKPGAKLILRHDGSTLGTVGGGRVESDTIEAARAALTKGTPCTLSFVLSEEHGFACGGAMTIFIEPHPGARRLVLFGAGHVGKAVAALAAGCGFQVTVVDERADCLAPGQFPEGTHLVQASVQQALERLQLDGLSYVVIATPAHLSDFDAVRGSLGTPARFIGLLGSRRKREALMKTLADEGFDELQRARIVTPVGVDIGAETPEEIAVSIVGQLIQERRNHAG